MKITVLGCGASLGVPAAGGFWGDCDPDNPKNERTRASILIESDETTILVDTTPDVRYHLNKHNVSRLDAVIYTHAHSDHIHGLDDLRVISYTMGHPVPAYTNAATAKELAHRFGYVFSGSHNQFYKPFMEINERGYGDITIGDINMTWFEQEHGSCKTIGIRIGDFAYSVDTLDLDETALETLKGVETWIVDCGGYMLEDDRVTTHANKKRVLKWVDMLKPEQTYLTVLTGRMDYDRLLVEFPDHVRPLYDGFEIHI